MNTVNTKLTFVLALTALSAQGCGFTYEPDPGSMASYEEPGAGSLDAGAAPPNNRDDETLHVIAPTAQGEGEADCSPGTADMDCPDPTQLAGPDGGVTEATDGSSPDAPNVPGELGEPCSPEASCAEGLICLHDPEIVDEESGAHVPYCTQVCADEQCPEAYECVQVEPELSACRLQSDD